MVRAVGSSIVVLLALMPSSAFTHAYLTNPTPRGVCDANCKTGPCGQRPAASVTKTFVTGSTYTISWIENVNHTATYRLAISTNGETSFDSFVIMAPGTVTDTVSDGSTIYNFNWTVPSVPGCQTSCVLQLNQFMTPGDYFNCADIQIVPAGTEPTPTPEETPTPTPGGNDGDGEVENIDAGGWCGVAAGAKPRHALLGLLALGLGAWAHRRRSPRA